MCELLDVVMAALCYCSFCCTGCYVWHLGLRLPPRAPRNGGHVAEGLSLAHILMCCKQCSSTGASGRLHVASPAQCAVRLSAAHSQFRSGWGRMHARLACTLLVHCHRMHARLARTLLVHYHSAGVGWSGLVRVLSV